MGERGGREEGDVVEKEKDGEKLTKYQYFVQNNTSHIILDSKSKKKVGEGLRLK